MAQSVAHFIGSEEVTGSIPVASFYVKDMRTVKIKVNTIRVPFSLLQENP